MRILAAVLLLGISVAAPFTGWGSDPPPAVAVNTASAPAVPPSARVRPRGPPFRNGCPE